MAALKGVCIGAGYFSRFHYEAWSRIPEVEITALCDLDAARAADVAGAFRIPAVYTDVRALLDSERPDFVDIITPPSTHEAICQEAGARGVSIICQKPFAPTIEEAERIVARAATDGVRLMVHENFRFQPWHREIKKLLEEGVIGEKLHTLTFTSRMGDGWGPEAYLGRQPYFRTMPRLLVYETGVHFIDTFRFLAGEVRQVYAVLRRLNPVIAGEDCGLLVFTFESGAVGVWDANRYNTPAGADPRYTFGTFLVEGDGGTLRLYEDGTVTLQHLGEPETRHVYKHEKRGFAGDCCYFTLRHFADCLLRDTPFETPGHDYLTVLKIQEAVYRSAKTGVPVAVRP